MAEIEMACSPRTPWFLPYVEAGARGSVQDGDVFCPFGTCDHCHTSRTIRYSDVHAAPVSA